MSRAELLVTCPLPWLDNGLPPSRGELLLCPICGDDFLHLGEVAVDQLGAEVRVGPTGPLLESHTCDRRGAVVRVSVHCEFGHAIAIQFAFHKGTTLLGWERLPDPDPWPATLARN